VIVEYSTYKLCDAVRSPMPSVDSYAIVWACGHEPKRAAPLWEPEGDVERTDRWPGSAGEHLLQERRGTTERARRFYSQQVIDHLNDRMRTFVSSQEMMFVSTSDGRGECDNTFRAGPPGFVRVLDAGRLAWPEYRGNGVLASLGNITENPHVGLLFVDFFKEIIGLHVNGTAEIIPDAGMRMAHRDTPPETIPGRRAENWVVVSVEEAYIHCAKHIPRLQKVPRPRDWGTDDIRRKGGDYFGTARTTGPRAVPAQRTASHDPHNFSEPVVSDGV